MIIYNLNQLPYTPPKYYHDICKKNNRQDINCLLDPFYIERLEIYNSVYQQFKQQTENIDDFQQRKQIMKRLLHQTYNNYNNNLGFLPYSYFTQFKLHAFDKIQQDLLDKNKKCTNLFNFIDSHVRKDGNYIVDPFYSFVTLIDWITQEMIEDSSIPDDYIIQYIRILIQKGYIGFNQYRFFLHVTIIRRKINKFIVELIELHVHFIDELEKDFQFNDGLLKCLLRDLMKFAVINNSYKIVKLFINKYGLSLSNDIPIAIQKKLCKIRLSNRNKNINNLVVESGICNK